MAKLMSTHQSSDGQMRKCKANVKPCPLGATEDHVPMPPKMMERFNKLAVAAEMEPNGMSSAEETEFNNLRKHSLSVRADNRAKGQAEVLAKAGELQKEYPLASVARRKEIASELDELRARNDSLYDEGEELYMELENGGPAIDVGGGVEETRRDTAERHYAMREDYAERYVRAVDHFKVEKDTIWTRGAAAEAEMKALKAEWEAAEEPMREAFAAHDRKTLERGVNDETRELAEKLVDIRAQQLESLEIVQFADMETKLLPELSKRNENKMADELHARTVRRDYFSKKAETLEAEKREVERALVAAERAYYGGDRS